MDIKDRKTALDDDSILYQKRDANSNKQDVKDLTKKGKLQYFADYYLMKVVIAVVVLIGAGAFLYNMIFHQQETILTVSSIGNIYMEYPDPLVADLREVFELTDEDQVVFVATYYLDDYNQQMAFTTHLAAREIDVIIMDKEQFERHAPQGVFADLSELLPAELYAELSDKLIEEQVVSYDVKNEVETISDPYPMAIDITHNPQLATYSSYDGEWYVGVCIGSQRMDNAVTFLDFLFHPERHELSTDNVAVE